MYAQLGLSYSESAIFSETHQQIVLSESIAILVRVEVFAHTHTLVDLGLKKIETGVMESK
jgi:hypothetical protein